MSNVTRKKECSNNKTPEITRFLSLLAELKLKPADIAESTKISKRTITGFIWENKPLGWPLLRKLHVIYGASIDWLVFGVGDMFCVTKSVADIKSDYVVTDPRITRIHAFVDEFMAAASADEKAWLEVQLKFTLPPYRAFVEKDDE